MKVQSESTAKPYNRKRGGHLRLESDQVGNSPRIALAVDATVYAQLVAMAEEQKTTISALTRKGLKLVVSGH